MTPTIAIVGRPNVGKSSLLNWLAGKRIAIVDATAGTTRDRVAAPVKLGDGWVEVVDTGGIGIQDIDDLTEDVEKQIRHAIAVAQLVLFVVDARTGVVALDEEVAGRLRTAGKPVICVVNKCDSDVLEPQSADFYRLGYGKPICVSAQQNRGKPELVREALKHVTPGEEAPGTPALKLAIVGKRNTGKSTFINWLAKEERVIVSEVPGTTRDSVDVRFERDGKAYLAIDTAGVKKKKSVGTDVEFYSLARAERSIRRADVVLHLFDPRPRIGRVDKQLTDYILTEHKPAIFVVNKWDLAGDVKTGTYADYVYKMFPMLDFVPVAFISSVTGQNVGAVLKLAEELHAQAETRVGTGDLNRVLRQALEQQSPPLKQNRRPKVFYATQVSTAPPTIVLFTNGPELFSDTYRRYLLKMFRFHLPFGDVPIKLYLRLRKREELGAEDGVEAEQGAKPRTKRPKAAPAEPELWDDV